ncbi:MAG: 50S ribosomal protein L6 [Candidatus Lernaella stagnicola]|nr:50S ribosomal protein L6 [Candidatus Lernaella stagnicola]
MSRIGKLPIAIPKGVKVQVNGRQVHVSGPQGKLQYEYVALVSVSEDEGRLWVKRNDETKDSSRIQGLTRTLINNMVIGVSEGYKRELDIVGVGYRAEVKGKMLVLNVGYSNPVEVPLPAGVVAVVEKNTHITLTGFDKQLLGQFAADVRKVRPPEPYKGKGIKYSNEIVRRKEGKKQG